MRGFRVAAKAGRFRGGVRFWPQKATKERGRDEPRSPYERLSLSDQPFFLQSGAASIAFLASATDL